MRSFKTTALLVGWFGSALFSLVPAPSRADTPSALAESPDGWKDLLAEGGAGLKGWTRGTIPPGGVLRGEGLGQWSFDPAAGVLVCQGDQGHDWLRWDEEVGDAVFHVEWRFVPVEGKRGYNSGVYIRNSADARIWHQAQTGGGSGGFLFGDTLVGGEVKRVNLSKEMTGQRVKPAGEWNTFELKAVGKEISLWVNGAVTCTLSNCEVPTGHVGLEAEGWRIEFRSVKLKKL